MLDSHWSLFESFGLAGLDFGRSRPFEFVGAHAIALISEAIFSMSAKKVSTLFGGVST